MYVCMCVCTFVYMYVCVYIYSTTDTMDMNLRKLQETAEVRGAWCATVHGVTESRIQLSDLITTATTIHTHTHTHI